MPAAGGHANAQTSLAAKPFSDRLLAWFETHGRKDLPWQLDPSPYRVWVSEVMLQQTQVQTVIPYFQAFMNSFPLVQALAAAPVDNVLHHWSGLGYYARARNLHAAAKQICADHGGKLPLEVARLTALPGIGRSTAGAILALACGIREPILDGNVKRVLTRYREIEGFPGQSKVTKVLWQVADELTPNAEVGAYTQAIMDLGATVCVVKRPLCLACPVQDDCRARVSGRQHELPTPRPKRELPQHTITFVMVRDNNGHLLLKRRPPAGIWGGLWGFPECETGIDVQQWCSEVLGIRIKHTEKLSPLAHGFTHYHLEIQPIIADVAQDSVSAAVMEGADMLWYNCASPQPVGLAAPVRLLIEQLRSIST